MASSPEIRYAVITGAGSGIGLATAELFLKNNWKVIAVGRTQSKLDALKARFPDSVTSIQCDLSKSSDVANLVSKISSLIPQTNALVNNAGVWKRLSFLETNDEIWRDQFETNVLGSVRLTRELLKLAIAQNTPMSVVNISSTLGVRPIADTSAYSASKAAMVSWTQTLALEVAKYKIRVNCICPGIVDTPIHQPPLPESLQSTQLLGRIGKPEDIANGVYYFCSEQAEWITGSTLNIDGGISL